MVLCGDFYQLSPVTSPGRDLAKPSDHAYYLEAGREGRKRKVEAADAADEEERALENDVLEEENVECMRRKPSYGGIPFGLKGCTGKFIFQTLAFRTLGFKIVELETVHRTSDTVLVDALRALRKGEANTEEVRRMIEAAQRPLDPELRPVFVMGTRKMAEKENQRRLEQLRPTPYLFRATDDVDADEAMSTARKMDLLRNIFFTKNIVHKEVSLKVGAQVMMVTHNFEEGLVNG